MMVSCPSKTSNLITLNEMDNSYSLHCMLSNLSQLVTLNGGALFTRPQINQKKLPIITRWVFSQGCKAEFHRKNGFLALTIVYRSIWLGSLLLYVFLLHLMFNS